MMEFIYGRTGTGKTKLCIDSIKDRLAANPQGNTLLLLCPDHMSFQLERQLGEATKALGGFARAHVLGISRFAYQVLSRKGLVEHISLNDLGRELLLSKVLARTELQVLRRSKQQPHFAATVGELINEFKNSGIYPDDLALLKSKITDNYLGEKIGDLQKIYAGLQEEMGNLYKDKADIIGLATELVLNSSWLKEAEVWIDGFDDFNQQHYALLKALLKVAKEVHITLCIPDLEASHSEELALFHGIYTMYMGACELAKELSIPISKRYLGENKRHRDKGLAHLANNFMSYPLVVCNETTNLKVVEVANARLECEAVAADIVALCRDKNYSYQDIGILIREEDKYGELLGLVLEDYDIASFWDKKTAINHHPLGELLRSLLDIMQNWQYEGIFRYLKTGFSPIAMEEIDALENYVLAVGIKGQQQWVKEEAWEFVPDYLRHKSSDYVEEINALRRKVAEPLKAFADGIKTSQTIEDFTRLLYEFLTVLEVPKKLEQWRNEAIAKKDLRLAKEHQQIWAKLMELFDELVALGKNEATNLKEYSILLADGLDALQMGLIPPGWDYVTIASFQHNTLNNKKAIYILGANEKVMPRQVKPAGLLTEKERWLVKDLGLPLNQGPWEENYGERYLLYKGFNLAREYLWVSYPLADEEGAVLGASVIIDWLKTLLPKAEHIYIPLSNMSQSKDMEITTPKRTLANLARALNEYRTNYHLKEYWGTGYNCLLEKEALPVKTVLSGLFTKAPMGKISEPLARGLYLKAGKLQGSVTRFETYTNCPFKHYLAYGLKLKPRGEAKFIAPNLGILLHEIMKAFGDYLKAHERRWGDVAPEECSKLCGEILANVVMQPNYNALRNNPSFKSKANRIKRLAELSLLRLIEFNRNSHFNPEILEGSFAPGEQLPTIVLAVDDFTIEIMGQIDRLDRDGNYFMVIDYKTGQGEISMLDIFYGLKLQLLTYLLVGYNALRLKGEEPIPAAMLYCFLKRVNTTSKQRLNGDELAKLVRSKLTMPGWFIADSDIIQRIDNKQEFIKITLNSDKSIHGSYAKSVKTKDEFMLLMDYLKEIYKITGGEIMSGETGIKPYSLGSYKACNACNFSSVCGFDKYIPGYNYRELEELEDENIVKRMKDLVGNREVKE